MLLSMSRASPARGGRRCDTDIDCRKPAVIGIERWGEGNKRSEETTNVSAAKKNKQR